MLICFYGAINFLIDIHEINNWYSCFTIIFSQCFNGMIFFSRYHHTIKKVLLLPAINRYYQALVRDIGGEPFRETVTSSQKLEIKLNKKYEKQIIIEKEKTIRGNIIYSSLMTSEKALRKHRQQVADQSTQIREVTLLLREGIMNAEKTPLP